MATDNKQAVMAKAGGNALAKKNGEVKDMKYWIKAYQPEIAKALPSVITPERFERMALTAIAKNEKLASSTPASFIGALLQAAQLGLEPNTLLGHAYLIPFFNGKTKQQETTFQLGYQGLIELAHRSGEIKEIYAEAVYPSDFFKFKLGLNRELIHEPVMDHTGEEPIYYYAVWKLVNGGYGFAVMSRAEIESHAKKYSQAYGTNYTPWKTAFDAMAKKTVIKQALKYAPIKVEFVRQMAADETVKTEISADMMDVEGDRLVLDDANFEVIDEETGEVIEDVTPIEDVIADAEKKLMAGEK